MLWSLGEETSTWTVYKTCVLPILIYGAESWVLSSKDLFDLNRTYINHLSSVLDIFYYFDAWGRKHYISHFALQAHAGLPSIAILISLHRLALAGRIFRANALHPIKSILFKTDEIDNNDLACMPYLSNFNESSWAREVQRDLESLDLSPEVLIEKYRCNFCLHIPRHIFKRDATYS